MPSVLLIVFVLNVVIHTINNVGASSFNDLLWTLFSLIPSASSPAETKRVALQKDLFKLKKELASISAQDEFARWAKVRRQHDKAQAEYDKHTQATQTSRDTFNRVAGVLRFLFTTGLRLALQFWHSKTPMFWLPQGWVPWYVEWGLSFPRAPMGSVSIQVWGFACAGTIKLVAEAVAAGWNLAQSVKDGGAKTSSGVNIEMESNGKMGAGMEVPMGMRSGAKKEL